MEAVQLTATREAGLAPIVKVSFGDPPALARDGKVGHGTAFPQMGQGLEGGDGIAVHGVDGCDVTVVLHGLVIQRIYAIIVGVIGA